MPKQEIPGVESASQPEVAANASGRLGVLSWLCHHAGQIAKGVVTLLGLAALGGVGYLVRGTLFGNRKSNSPETPKDKENAGEGEVVEKIDEVITPGAMRSFTNRKLLSINDGLVAYYPFNGNADDESGNGNHGTVYGAHLTTDRFGNANRAYSFNGIDNYIKIGDPVPASLQIQYSVSLSAWIYVTSYAVPSDYTLGLIVGCQYDSTRSGISLQLDTRTNSDYQTNPPGHIHFQIGDGSWHATNTKSQVPLNQWVHLVAIRNANEDATIYYNGVSQPLTSAPWSGAVTYVDSMYAIGKQKDFGGRYFNGTIDDIRVYNRALSASEVATLYAEANPAPALIVEGSKFADISVVAGSIVDTGNGFIEAYNVAAEAEGMYFTGDITSWAKLGKDLLGEVTDFILETRFKPTDLTNGAPSSYYCRSLLHFSNTGDNVLSFAIASDGRAYSAVMGEVLEVFPAGTFGINTEYKLNISRTNGIISYSVNDGEHVFTREYSANLTFGCVVLGQDQDTCYGGFEAPQAFQGYISEFKFEKTVPVSPVSYIENSDPVILAPTLRITDPDSTNLASATVKITGGFAVGEDVLSFTPQAGITGSYNASTGILTFNGIAPIAVYRILLQSVAYMDSSENPSTAYRIITFQVVDDKGAISEAAAQTVQVIAVNDVPVIVQPIANQTASVGESFSLVLDPSQIFSDADGDEITITNVTLSDGSPLPGWLRLEVNLGRRNLTGTPTRDNLGSLQIKVTASDGNGGEVSNTFTLTLRNDYPLLNKPLAKQVATAIDEPYYLIIPKDTFVHEGGGDVTYIVTLEDGSALSDWLHQDFTAQGVVLTGVPRTADEGITNIKVTANYNECSTSETFHLKTSVRPVGEFRVNNYTSDNQAFSTIAKLTNGNFVITWQSDGQDGSSTGIFAQTFTAAGLAIGSEFQVNNYTTGAQFGSAILSLKEGGFVITWVSAGQDGSGNGVYGQMFDGDGRKNGNEFQVNTYTNADQTAPWQYSTASLSDGKFVVTWWSAQAGSNDIYAQIFNADGSRYGGEFRVNTIISGNQNRPAIAALDDGKFVITWHGDMTYNIHGQIFNDNGSLFGSEFQVNTYTQGGQAYPDVVGLSDGKFVVTWCSDGQDGSGNGIYGQIFNASGSKSGNEFRVNTYTQGEQGNPSAVSLDGNRFLVTWLSAGQDGSSYGIYAQLMNSVGEKIGNEFQVNEFTTGSQIYQSIAVLEDGRAIISWQSRQDGSDFGIYAKILNLNHFFPKTGFCHQIVSKADGFDQIFFYNKLFTGLAQPIANQPGKYYIEFEGQLYFLEKSGSNLIITTTVAGDSITVKDFKTGSFGIGLVGEELQVNTYTAGDQYISCSTKLSNGNFVVVWNSDGQDGDGSGVYGQIFSAAGEKIGIEFSLSTTTTGVQRLPTVAELENGKFVAVWKSNISGDYDIYAQLFDGYGCKLGAEFRVNDYLAFNQEEPSVIGLPNGKFMVVWGGPGVEHPGLSGIFGRTFNSSGLAQGSAFTISNYTTSRAQVQPSAAAFPSGKVVVVWDNYEPDGSYCYGVYGQIIDETGQKIGQEFAVNTFNNGMQKGNDAERRVAVSGNGNFMVVWTDFSGHDGSSNGVYGRLFDPTGNAITGDFKLNEFTLGDQSQAAIASLSNGHFIVVWHDGSDPEDSGFGIYGQEYSELGVPIGSNFHINTYLPSDQRYPSVTALENDAYVVSWSSLGQDGSGSGIFATLLSANKNYFYTSASFGNQTIESFSSSDKIFFDNVELTGLAQPFVNNPNNYFLEVNGKIFFLEKNGTDLIITLQDNPSNSLTIKNYRHGIFGIGMVGEEFQISSVPIEQGGALPIFPTAVETEDGKVLIAWQSRIDNKAYVMARFINQYGVFVNSPFIVNDLDHLASNDASISSTLLTNGDVVITWVASSLGASNYGVFLKLMDSSGIHFSQEIMVSNSVAYGPWGYMLYVQSLANGDFVIVWPEYAVTYNQVRGKRYSSAGVELNAFNIGDPNNHGRNAPVVAQLKNGTLIVAWISNNNIGGQGFPYFKIINLDGGIIVDKTIVSDSLGNNSENPKIGVLADGRFVIVWQDHTGLDGSGIGIYAQIFSEHGIKLNSTFRVNTVIQNSQADPHILVLENNGFLITWESAQFIEYGTDIYGQYFTSDGEKLGSDFRINEVRIGGQSLQRAINLGGRDVLTVWSSQLGSKYLPVAKIFSFAQDYHYYFTAFNNQIVATSFSDESRIFVDGKLFSGTAYPVENLPGKWFMRHQGKVFIVERSPVAGEGCNLWIYSLGQSANKLIIQNFETGQFGIEVFADEFHVNTAVMAPSHNARPKVSKLVNGNFIIVWEVEEGNIYAQLFSPIGKKIGTQFVIDEVAATTPFVSGLSNGNFVVAWTKIIGSAGVRMQLYDQNIKKIGIGYDFGVGDGIGKIVELADNEFIITWSPWWTHSVYAQRFNGTGNTIGERITVNTNPVGDTQSNCVSKLSNGNFVVVWGIADLDGDSIGVFGQIFNINCEKQGTEFPVNTYTTGWQGNPSIAPLLDGKFIVTWTGDKNGHGGIISAQIFEANGTKIGSEFEVNTYAARGRNGDRPVVANFVNGGFIIVWQGKESSELSYSEYFDIFAQVFDANYVKVGSIFKVNHYVGNDQVQPDIVMLSNGSYVIAWPEGQGAGPGRGVFAKIITEEFFTLPKHYVYTLPSFGQPIITAFKAEDEIYFGSTQFQGAALPITNQPNKYFLKLGDQLFFLKKNGATLEITVAGNSQDKLTIQSFELGQFGIGLVGGEFRVNTYTVGDQYYSAIGMLTNGDFIVTWQTDKSDGHGLDIYGQIFTAGGRKKRGEFLINNYRNDLQGAASVISLPNGNFWVVWQSQGQDGDTWGIYGKIYNAEGNVVKSEFCLSQITDYVQADVSGTVLKNGEIVINWNDQRYGQIRDIYGRIFDQDGNALSDDFLINAVISGYYEAWPSITSLENGGFVVVWFSNHGSGSGTDLYGQIFDKNRNKVGGEFQVNLYSSGSQQVAGSHPGGEIAGLNNGDFVVVWQSYGQDGDNWGVYGQIFSATGTRKGEEFKANEEIVGVQNNPAVSKLKNGCFLVVWQSDKGDSIQAEIMGQLYRENGEKIGGNFKINTYTIGAQTVPMTHATEDGGYLVSWISDAQDGSGKGVYAKIILPQNYYFYFLPGLGQETISALDFSSDQIYINNELLCGTAWPIAGETNRFKLTVGAKNYFLEKSGSNLVITFEGGNSDSLTIQNFVNGQFGIGLIGEEFRVNNRITGDQINPAVTKLSNGNFVITFATEINDSKEIYGRIYQPNGVPITNEFLINQVTTDEQSQAVITGLNNGNFVAVWKETDEIGIKSKIKGQIFDANGQAIACELEIKGTEGGIQDEPTITVLVNDGFIVTWQSKNTDGDGWGIYAQVFNEQGRKLGESVLVNNVTAGDQIHPATANLEANGFIAIWQGENGVYGKRFDLNGNAVSGEFQVNGDLGVRASYPKIAVINEELFVVVWQGELANGAGYNIYGQMYNANGEKVSNEFIANQTVIGNQTQPRVEALEDNRFIVSWESTDGIGRAVYAQVYNNTGNKIGDQFRASVSTLNDQSHAVMTSLGNGQFALVWQSEERDSDGGGIYAKILTTPPSVAKPTKDLTVGVGTEFKLVLDPTEIFHDPENKMLAITDVTLADGSVLPDWLTLKFNPKLSGNCTTPGMALGLAVSDHYVFVADWTSGLQIIDIADVNAPVVVGSYGSAGSGVHGIVILDNLAFLADYGFGLQIVDISDVQHPALVGTYPSVGIAAYGVAVLGNHAFLTGAEAGLKVLDITDPYHPTLVGSCDTPGEARGIVVQDHYAFIADWHSGLQVVDIANTSSPVIVGSCDIPGSAHGIVVSGNYAFVADYSVGLQVIDISDPTHPNLIGSSITGGAYGISITDHYIFLADWTLGLKIIDVSNSSTPKIVGAYDTPGTARGVAVFGNHVLVADNESGLQIIDIRIRELFGTPQKEAAGKLSLKVSGTDGTLTASNLFDLTIVPKLTISHSNQTATYIEDIAFDFENIVIETPSTTVDITLTMSDATAGALTTGVSGDVTSTFANGVWHASGNVTAVNQLLAGLQFTPAKNYNQNFAISVQVDDHVNYPYNDTISITGVAVNDAPELSTGGGFIVYIEDNSPQVIDSSIAITDVDNPNMAGAVIWISSGFVQGEDVLEFANQNGITGSYNAATGELTLSGSASKANYEIALRTIKYKNTSENPSLTGRIISFKVNDGALYSNIVTRGITVQRVNDVPVISIPAGSISYTEDNAPVIIASTLSIIDVDSINLQNATVRITSGFVPSEDLLSFTPQAGITGSYDAQTGVLTFTGIASIADYQTLLRSVTYKDSSQNPFTANRSITFQVTDNEGAASIAATKTLQVIAVNDAPVLSSFGGSFVYVENAVATVVDGSITVTDVDNENVASAVIWISSGFTSGEDVLEFTNQNGITGSYNAATGALTLSGNTTKENYQIALRTIKYKNISDNPSLAERIISFKINDGALDSNVVTRGIAIQAVNDAPVLSSSGGSFVYVENALATVVDGSVVVSDVDNPNVANATVWISSGFASGEDGLEFTNQNGITGSYNTATGALALSGTTTKENYQIALRSIKYKNISDNPSLAERIISFKVNDGELDSNIITRGITVQRANDAPVINIPSSSISYTEDDAPVIIAPALSITDVDSVNLKNATVKITDGFVVEEDVLFFTPQAGIIGSYDTQTGVLTFTGIASIADYQTLLRSVTYRDSSQNPSTANRSITFQVTDNEGAASVAVTKTLQVIAVNDAPVLSSSGGSFVYVENAVATVVDASITVADVDNPNIASATVWISSGFANGEDVLEFTNQNGITGSYNTATGALTLSGIASKENYQVALRSIKYKNTSENPSLTGRTISFKINDGALDSNVVTRGITVQAVNDAPVLTSSGGSFVYVENALATVVDASIGVTDVDNPNVANATVWISSGFANGEDVLEFTDQNGITGSYNAATGELTLSGSASKENYQIALRSIKYKNTSDNPSLAERIISFKVNYGALDSNVVTRGITVQAVNDAPVLSSSGGSFVYVENAVATVVDASISVTDVDNPNIASATVWISSGFANGEDVLEFTNQNGITGNYNPATGALTLSGIASKENYQIALRSIKYKNTSENPSLTGRTISFKVNDGTLDSNVVTRGITVQAVNDAPVINIPVGSISYTEDSIPVIIASTLSITDVDSANLQNATVQITSGFVAFEDVLSFTPQAGIVGSYDAQTGVLTFTGVASITDYQTLLQSVAYKDSSQNPSTANRSITFQVTDNEGAASVAATKTVQVIAINDAPVLSSSGGFFVYVEKAVATVVDASIGVTDVDNPNIASATVWISSGFAIGEDVLEFTNQNGITGSYNAATGALTLSGSASKENYQVALRSIKYKNTSDNPSPTRRTISFKINDGTLDSNVVTRGITVQAVNDAPELYSSGGSITYVENSPAQIIDSGITVGDVDSTDMAGAVVWISSGFANGEDVLEFTDQNGITGSYNAATGELILSGSASKENYQVALRTIKYKNTSENPSLAERIISFKINDGALDSNVITRGITVQAVNDAPVLIDRVRKYLPQAIVIGREIDFGFTPAYCFADVDNPLNITVTNLPGFLHFEFNGTYCRFTRKAGSSSDVGHYAIDIIANDGQYIASDTFSLSVGEKPQGEFVVNTYTSNNQQNPVITSLCDNFVVLWQSAIQNGGVSGIYGQIVSPDGVKIGYEKQIGSIVLGSQTQPAVASLSDGTFMTSWIATNAGQTKIYYQLFNQYFEPIVATTLLESSPSMLAVNIIALDDQFMVVYGKEASNGKYGIYGIFGRIIDKNGMVTKGEFEISSTKEKQLTASQLIRLNNGQIVIAWNSLTNRYRVGLRVYNAAEDSLSAPIWKDAVLTGNSQKPSLTPLTDGGFMLGYHSLGTSGVDIGIYLQRFDHRAQELGSATLVRTYEAETQTSMISLADGRMVVLWHDGHDTLEKQLGIFGQIFTAEGKRDGGAFHVNEYIVGMQTLPVAVTLPGRGDCVICWQSGGNRDGSGDAIAARILTPPPYVKKHLSLEIPVAKVGINYQWSFAEDTFANIDPTQVIYTATLANDDPLPEWLKFDNRTRTFSGMPNRAYEGNLHLKVTVRQGIYEIFDTVTLVISSSLALANTDRPIYYREEYPFMRLSVASEVSSTVTVVAKLSEISLGSLLAATYQTVSSSYNANTGTLTITGATTDVQYLLSHLKIARNNLQYRGDSSLTITVTDGINNPIEQEIFMQGNRAPRMVYPLGDQKVGLGKMLSKELAQVFVDDDNDPLTMSVVAVNTAKASVQVATPPNWVTLDSSTKMLSVAPRREKEMTLVLEVLASDGLLTASDRFNLTLLYTLYISPCGSLRYVEGTTLTLPPFTFSSEVSDALTTSLTLSDPKAGMIGTNLATTHAAMSFNQTTGIWELRASVSEVNLIWQDLKFIPLAHYDKNFKLTLKVDDGIQEIERKIEVVAQPVNDPPEFAKQLGKRLIDSGKFFEFSVSDIVFDIEGDPIVITASLADGRPLPKWLKFENGTFVGTPGDEDAGRYEIKLTAFDGVNTASEIFVIQVAKKEPKKELPIGLIAGLSVGLVSLLSGVAVGWKVYATRKLRRKLTAVHREKMANPLALKNANSAMSPLFSHKRSSGIDVSNAVPKPKPVLMSPTELLPHAPRHGSHFFGVVTTASPISLETPLSKEMMKP